MAIRPDPKATDPMCLFLNLYQASTTGWTLPENLSLPYR